MNWLNVLMHVLGIDRPSRFMNFWDGFGSGPVQWLFLPLIYIRHHNCHTKWCWRMGHPDSSGTVVCRKHNARGSQMTPDLLHSAQGRDVSDFQVVQTVHDWAGYDFGFTKATEGTAWTSKTCVANIAVMRSVAKRRQFFPGFYHFLHPGEDAVAQAQHFVDRVKFAGLKPGDMLVVDSEILNGLKVRGTLHAPLRNHAEVTDADFAATETEVDAATLAFCDEVRRLVGPNHPVLVYTMNVVGQHLAKTAEKYPLWFAYPSQTAPPASMIAPWKTWLFWQWSFAASGGGDADAFNGTAAELAAFIATYLPKPKPPKVHKLLIVAANGTESLRDVAKRYSTTSAWIIAWTFRNIAWVADRRFGAYVLRGNWSAPLPRGTALAVWAWVPQA